MANFWTDKRVLVTGSAGFLGCWLCNILVENGACVTGLDIEIKPKSNFYNFNLKKRIKQLHVDVTNYALLRKIFSQEEPEIVFHLAAQPLVTLANKNPLPTFENNIKGTWNVLEAARNSRSMNGVVVASSDKAYGIHETLPYTEDAPLRGAYPYDVSKSAADLITQAYSKTYGLPVGITRSGNFYGGGDLYFDRIVPGTIKSLIFDEAPIIRSDGRFVRDYIYIKDVANAYMLLAKKLKQVRGEAFNLTTEEPLDVLALVSTISRLMGKQHLKPSILNIAKAEIREQYLSGKKARELLDWSAKYSLGESLKETITWYKQYFDKGFGKEEKKKK
ncbi:MAG TPA: NAD-dependent epimerase/dehydratase family protein [Nanoarchaeota archaeon]|nr:MAG: NAD-dependent epimerase/dehydratase [archaeon GW2011_AR6]HIH17785.1 NAD-dependent epimerase/dehydratase family protein [Nanoarchaeota archaeon]HIH34039.1 NAD-dependent epimerase/dehydratase family protein [Nanoarchaeota archaeon]HIH51653.1 NAD-dependent epimerase/dehydratase family protein [Nanoarchaeota archaeon]HIH66247.1 NAD-dependent epimerase/dehydratase family protein [Nanoarchaeota archaeon]